METERFIGGSEHRGPSEAWLRRRRSARTDTIVQVATQHIPQDILPAPKNPVPLLKEDVRMLHERAGIQEVPRSPSVVRPPRNPQKSA